MWVVLSIDALLLDLQKPILGLLSKLITLLFQLKENLKAHRILYLMGGFKVEI